MSLSFSDYFRCPEIYSRFIWRKAPHLKQGYFSFGPDATCFGRYSGRSLVQEAPAGLHDALEETVIENGEVYLPFDPDEIAENLRRELYVDHWRSHAFSFLVKVYYFFRPALPISIRSRLQQLHLRGWENLSFPSWPVDCSVDELFNSMMLLALRASGAPRIPFIWFWPDGKNSCAIMTHDVESEKGRDFCSVLMDIDDSRSIKSSFQIIPEERYDVSDHFLQSIRDRGFEVAVHDLNHDGHLYRSRAEFLRRSTKINSYIEKYRAEGFRAGVLYRKQLWYDALKCSYDMSVPNVARLDPQRGGCCTVMPYFVGDILEIPVTAVQDYTLFYILKDYSTRVWKWQAEEIMKRHGLISFIVHPDYIMKPHARQAYESLLDSIAEMRQTQGIWTATPGEVNRWWRQRAAMTLAQVNGNWEVGGEGSERACIAYASKVDGHLVITLPGSREVLTQSSAACLVH
jgi:hypothetical protein